MRPEVWESRGWLKRNVGRMSISILVMEEELRSGYPCRTQS